MTATKRKPAPKRKRRRPAPRRRKAPAAATAENDVQERRRGEVPYVAVSIGLESNPKVQALARRLKLPIPHVLGLLALWDAFILKFGDARTGRVKGFTASEIADGLYWDGSPRGLLAELKRAGVLQPQRSTFFHPFWLETPTGWFANNRADRRHRDMVRKREEREMERAARELALAREMGISVEDVRRLSGGRPLDGRATTPDGADQPLTEGTGVGGPPPCPPQAGGGSDQVAEERYRWLKIHRKNTCKRARCLPYLRTMSADTWAKVQWVVLELKSGRLSIQGRGKIAVRSLTPDFLANEYYDLFEQEWVQKLQADKEGPKRAAEPEPEEHHETPEEKHQRSRERLQVALADQELSDVFRQRAIAAYLKFYPGDRFWETPAQKGGAS